jgi:2-isopropylmalate synthase
MSNSSADNDQVVVYDTTLRDGTQREGVSYTLRDKLRIARRLDAFGIDFIEGGWPFSNPKDSEFFRRAKDMDWQHACITAFGSTRRAQFTPEDDPNLRALIDTGAPACTIFGKSWTLHVSDVLRVSLDKNLELIEESVAFLKQAGRRVIYDAEHFFDGYVADASYAIETLKAAIRGGAEVVTLCETNGGQLPWRVAEVTEHVLEVIRHPVGIHAHDDTGCGVANSLAAIRAGARHVQGTINGYGERCGNANLSAIIPNLELKLGFRTTARPCLAEITELSLFVSEVANLVPNDHQAYVGRAAFAHKGGVHVAAMRRHPDSYQHIDPKLVGNEMRVVVSELSGRGNVLSKAEELGVQVHAGHEQEALNDIKEAEARGVCFEGAEASVSLLLRRKAPAYQAPFELLDYQTMVGKRLGTETFAEATVKLSIEGTVVHTAADGNGPVAALAAALRKALVPFYPEVEKIHLEDYKVRILDGAAGTEAITRVLIDSGNGSQNWSTVGASSNIIEASMHALLDSIEYGLSVAKPARRDSAFPPSSSPLSDPAEAARPSTAQPTAGSLEAS